MHNKSAAAVTSGLAAIDHLLRGVGISKSAAEGTGPDSAHPSNRTDPNNMTPPTNKEGEEQHQELVDDVPGSIADGGLAFNDGTPEDGSFQGANTNEVLDAPEVTPTHTPEDTDAGTASPANVDVDNVEGKAASFHDHVRYGIKVDGLHKTATDLGSFCLEQLNGVLGPIGATQKSASRRLPSISGEDAAALDFYGAIRSNPQAYMREKVAAVRSEAYASADLLYQFLCKRAEEELPPEALAGGEEGLPPEAAAELAAIAEGGEGGGGGGGAPDEEAASEEELIAALSDALDAQNVEPEQLPELEAGELPPDMPPELKEASLRYIADWAAGVNSYRNAQRLGKVQTKRASVRSIQITNGIASRLDTMLRHQRRR